MDLGAATVSRISCEIFKRVPVESQPLLPTCWPTSTSFKKNRLNSWATIARVARSAYGSLTEMENAVKALTRVTQARSPDDGSVPCWCHVEIRALVTSTRWAVTALLISWTCNIIIINPVINVNLPKCYQHRPLQKMRRLKVKGTVP